MRCTLLVSTILLSSALATWDFESENGGSSGSNDCSEAGSSSYRKRTWGWFSASPNDGSGCYETKTHDSESMKTYPPKTYETKTNTDHTNSNPAVPTSYVPHSTDYILTKTVVITETAPCSCIVPVLTTPIPTTPAHTTHVLPPTTPVIPSTSLYSFPNTSIPLRVNGTGTTPLTPVFTGEAMANTARHISVLMTVGAAGIFVYLL
ncbi:hypothetical protein BUE80_DR013215 [Diplocarpon rosae]|nr:hypothetical protein BUE80_DR013215 [Diplocarpon rosae]